MSIPLPASLLPMFGHDAAPSPGLRGQARMAPTDRLDPELYARGSRDCRRATVLLLLYPWQQALYAVLIVRPRHLPDHPGQVALPGGMKDEEETVEQTRAARGGGGGGY